MLQGDLALTVESLLSRREPFVLATVVRARHPTSVRPGDAAIVHFDGSIEGFVGGVCAESSVRLHGLKAMETGEPLLLRLVPDGDDSGNDVGGSALDGAVIEHNPCLSGGALEIFLEPHLPAARVVVVGSSPIAVALETLARAAGYDTVRALAGEGTSVDGAAAVIVASHGSAEEGVLSEALRAGVPYVALVASPKRGAAVREELEVAPELAEQLLTPAGLDIGARTPAEIAISILAELVVRQHSDPAPGRPAAACEEGTPSSVTVATDPVCGMKVAMTDSTLRLESGGAVVYFCSDHCRQAYAAKHAESHAAR
jgi:xanthine dehydrogenase accessory factor